ncbi:MAG: hypothetical protein J5662_09150 [Clostridia bacterium]|nr:hypothetical protein [Clostridia bacterium]
MDSKDIGELKNKQGAINKVASLLNDGGRFVLSIDKNQNDYIEYGNRKIPIYPDSAEKTAQYIKNVGLTIQNQYETEFAYIFVARKTPDYISH